MKIGIVGNGADKFSPIGQERAKRLIHTLLLSEGQPTLVSGHSPVGGVDIWAEEMATELGIPLDIKHPAKPTWEGGYKQRNLLIAQDSDVVHVIVARNYPSGYKGMRFNICYHCKKNDHVKSGACWTAKRAKKAIWHYIDNEVMCFSGDECG